MTELTRRRNCEASEESWDVSYGDVRVDWIGIRAGVPVKVDQWAGFAAFAATFD